jgi:hypothetical protein
VIVDETPEPGTPWEAELVDFCRGSVIPGGKLIVAGGSTTVRRAEKALSNDFRVRADRKMHGTRAALFVRKR